MNSIWSTRFGLLAATAFILVYAPNGASAICSMVGGNQPQNCQSSNPSNQQCCVTPPSSGTGWVCSVCPSGALCMQVCDPANCQTPIPGFCECASCPSGQVCNAGICVDLGAATVLPNSGCQSDCDCMVGLRCNFFSGANYRACGPGTNMCPNAAFTNRQCTDCNIHPLLSGCGVTSSPSRRDLCTCQCTTAANQVVESKASGTCDDAQCAADGGSCCSGPGGSICLLPTVSCVPADWSTIPACTAKLGEPCVSSMSPPKNLCCATGQGTCIDGFCRSAMCIPKMEFGVAVQCNDPKYTGLSCCDGGACTGTYDSNTDVWSYVCTNGKKDICLSCETDSECKSGDCCTSIKYPDSSTCTRNTCVPPAPGGLNDSVNGDHASVQWNAVAGASSYGLRIRDIAAPWSIGLCNGAVSGGYCTDSNILSLSNVQLDYDRDYMWWVFARAVNIPYGNTCFGPPSYDSFKTGPGPVDIHVHKIQLPTTGSPANLNPSVVGAAVIVPGLTASDADYSDGIGTFANAVVGTNYNVQIGAAAGFVLAYAEKCNYPTTTLNSYYSHSDCISGSQINLNSIPVIPAASKNTYVYFYFQPAAACSSYDMVCGVVLAQENNAGLGGIVVELVNSKGIVMRSMRSASQTGAYAFPLDTAGTYFVRVVPNKKQYALQSQQTFKYTPGGIPPVEPNQPFNFSIRGASTRVAVQGMPQGTFVLLTNSNYLPGSPPPVSLTASQFYSAVAGSDGTASVEVPYDSYYITCWVPMKGSNHKTTFQRRPASGSHSVQDGAILQPTSTGGVTLTCPAQ